MAAVPASAGPVGFITINVDPVLNLGPLPIHWYGVMYAVAFLAAYQFGVLPYAKRRGLPKAVAEKITVWTIIFGLLGGRLYYVVQQPDLWNNYVLHPINIIAFWQGGMAFFGAIIVGFITLAICAWRYGYNPWIALDGGVLFAVVGQPIGRIGNIINGDILGAPSTHLPVGHQRTTKIPHAILQSCFCRLGVPYQPAAAYEAIGTIIIGVILYLLLRRNPRAGFIAIVYVGLYAISQLILFEFRASEPPGPLGLREAQWTSIAMPAVLGVPAALPRCGSRRANDHPVREALTGRTRRRQGARRSPVTQLLLYNVIGFVEVALTVLIIARIAVSWIGLSPWHPVVRWLRIIVDPILAPFRRILPSFSGIDFSPILAIVVIFFVAQILQTLVLGGGIDPAATIVALYRAAGGGHRDRDRGAGLHSHPARAVSRRPLASTRADGAHDVEPARRTLRGIASRGHSSTGFDYPAIAALVMYIVLIIVIRLLFGFLLNSV